LRVEGNSITQSNTFILLNSEFWRMEYMTCENEISCLIFNGFSLAFCFIPSSFFPFFLLVLLISTRFRFNHDTKGTDGTTNVFFISQNSTLTQPNNNVEYIYISRCSNIVLLLFCFHFSLFYFKTS
jgi:hypothetical protein